MRNLFFVMISFLMLLTGPVYASVLINPNQNTSPVTASKQITAKEKKVQLNSLKKKLKEYKKHKRAEDRQILLAILAILLPPLAVYLHQEAINTKFWLSVILTLFFWVPGVIYSLLVVLDAI